MRVAVGAVAKRIFRRNRPEVASHISIEIEIGNSRESKPFQKSRKSSEVGLIVVPEQEEAVKAYIDQVKRWRYHRGIVETLVGGVPVNQGSYVQCGTRNWMPKSLKGWLPINAFKGVELVLGSTQVA